jgi:lysozyme
LAGSYDRAVLRAELRRDEGERLRVYRCTADKRTIGVGRNLDDVGISPVETIRLGITVATCLARGITSTQSMALLDGDIDRAEADLDRHLPWWRRLDGVRQRVLLNMCFNLGVHGLLGFRNTLGMIERRQFAAASENMLLSKWARQVGTRAQRLSRMMRTGVAA